jgi:hypothetical protein
LAVGEESAWRRGGIEYENGKRWKAECWRKRIPVSINEVGEAAVRYLDYGCRWTLNCD